MGEQRKQARPIETDGPSLPVDTLDWQAIVEPAREPDDFDISQIVPGRNDIARSIDKLLGRTAEEVARIAGHGLDAVFTLPRESSPWAARVVDEELPESPLAFLDLG